MNKRNNKFMDEKNKFYEFFEGLLDFLFSLCIVFIICSFYVVYFNLFFWCWLLFMGV
jgi:hypothetical protein